MIEKGFLSKVRNFLTLGSAGLVATTINALFWMYLASILDKSEYGMLGYLISIATVGHAVSTLGIGTTIIVYGAKKENILSPAYTLGLISSTVASIVVFVITQNVALSFLTWGMMIFLLKAADLNSKKQYLSFAKYRVLRSVLKVVIAIVLFQIFGINGIILGFALATMPALGGLYNYLKNRRFTISLLKPKVNFMLNSWIAGLTGTLFLWGDKIMIGTILGFSVLGSYHLAFQYLMLLHTVPGAIFIYLLPQESEGKSNKKIKIFFVGISILLVIVGIVFAPFAIGAFFPEYQESIIPAQILSLSLIPMTISSIYESRLFGKELPKFAVIGSVIQVIVYFSLIVWFGLEFGLVGIAVAFLLSTVSRATFNGVVTRTL